MADRQGGAHINMRAGAIVMVAASESMGWQTDSGIWRGLTLSDREAFWTKASLETPDDTLGALLRECMKKSRLVTLEWSREYRRRPESEYDERLAAAFGLSSTRGLYRGMKDVGVDWADDEVQFVPTRNRGRGVFEGFQRGRDQGHEVIVLPFEVPDNELGAALQEAIRRSL